MLELFPLATALPGFAFVRCQFMGLGYSCFVLYFLPFFLPSPLSFSCIYMHICEYSVYTGVCMCVYIYVCTYLCMCVEARSVLHCHPLPHFQKGSVTEPDPGLWPAKCCDPLPLPLYNAWVPAMHMTMSIKLFVLALGSRLKSLTLHSKLMHSFSLRISGTLLCIFLRICGRCFIYHIFTRHKNHLQVHSWGHERQAM